MSLFSSKPERRYRILVQYTKGGKWIGVYTGPWNAQAETVWRYKSMYPRRVYQDPTDRDVQAMFYGHPDLIELEKHFDRYYVVPGDENDPPNRLVDAEKFNEIRRAVRKTA